MDVLNVVHNMLYMHSFTQVSLAGAWGTYLSVSFQAATTDAGERNALKETSASSKLIRDPAWTSSRAHPFTALSLHCPAA